MVLPKWNELSAIARRSPKRQYELIRAEFINIQNSNTTYKVTVSVKNTDGENISGATVTLTNSTDSSKTFTGTSGSAGGCTINVPPAIYNVSTSATNYVTATDNITIEASDKPLNVVMTAVDDDEEEGE